LRVHGAEGGAGGSTQRRMERGRGCVERNRSERSKVANVAEWKPPASTEAQYSCARTNDRGRPLRRSVNTSGVDVDMFPESACISYPTGGVVPPGSAGVTIFASCMNGVSRSIGTGKMVVELFSAATSDSV